MEPPPGTLSMTTAGLPGRFLVTQLDMKRAQTSVPPPTPKGTVQVRVSGTSAAACTAEDSGRRPMTGSMTARAVVRAWRLRAWRLGVDTMRDMV
ncbi:hypothetical protein CU110_06675 [Cobetia sp. ICG0124]|nr:hypothetical protein CU110_06675 [Cobetia sp. ICG0124]